MAICEHLIIIKVFKNEVETKNFNERAYLKLRCTGMHHSNYNNRGVLATNLFTLKMHMGFLPI